MDNSGKVRLDKWLWSVRIFKTRTMATDACKSGKVRKEGVILKPSYAVVEEDVLNVHKNGFDFVFKVNKLIDRRVSATLAAPCFDDLTPPDELNKFKDWFIGKSGIEFREKGSGRPTKKDRRTIENFKDTLFDDFFDEL